MSVNIRMRKFMRRHAEFVRHVSAMMSGRAIAAALGLLLTPVVARLFSPNDFGVAASFISIVGIASQVASLRYDAAIVLPKTEQEARHLTALSYRLLPLYCAALFGLLGLYEASGMRWSAIELLGHWTWALPVGVLLMGALSIQESWLTRTKAFGAISASVVLETGLGGAVRIGLGMLTGTSVYALIIGSLTGVLGRLVTQGLAGVDSVRAAFGQVSYAAMRKMAQRYSDFPKLNAPAGFIYSTGQQLPVVIFGAVFSPAIAGFYAMAYRLAQVPVQIVATSMRRVFLQKAAAMHNDGRALRRPFVLVTLGLAVIGAAPFAVVWLFGQPVITWFLGERWAVAGRYLEIIAPWVFMIWLAAPCNSIFIVLRRQGHWLLLQTGLTIIRLSPLGIGYTFGLNAEDTLQLFVIVTVAGYITTIITALVLSGSRS